MSNPLPTVRKKELGRAYALRFALVGSIAALALAALTILVLAAIEVSISIEAKPLSSLEGAAATQAKQISNERATLSDTQKIVDAVTVYSATSSPALAAIAAAIMDRPNGVTLTSIAYTASTHTLQLAGEGPAGSAHTYSDALKADPHFTDVQVPVGALISAAKQFTVTLAVQF